VSEYLRYQIYYGLKNTDDIVVFARRDTGDVVRPDEDFVIRCWDKFSYADFFRALMSHPVDVINIHHEYTLMESGSLVQMIRALRALGIKVVLTMHTTSDGENMNNNPLAGAADWTITHTRTVGDRVTNIPLPFIDLPVDHTASRKKFDEIYHTDGALLVGHFGFPFGHKNHRAIIDAVAGVAGAVLVFLFGKRDLTANNVAGIIAHAWQRQVPCLVIHEFLEIERVIEILSACDVGVFAYPGEWSGHSGAIRICMSARIPIVTTRTKVVVDALDYLDVCEPGQLPEAIVKARGTEIRYLDYLKANSCEAAMQKYLELFQRLPQHLDGSHWVG